jgi:hypothetical protein
MLLMILATAVILMYDVFFNGTNVALSGLVVISILPIVQLASIINLDKFRRDE